MIIKANDKYIEPVINYREYESSGIGIPSDSPRDLSNESESIVNGRLYRRINSTIFQSAIVSSMRFKIANGKTIIGRDIINYVDSNDLAIMVESVITTVKSSSSHPLTMTINDTIVKFWRTKTGKTAGSGNGFIRMTHPKVYKRNRKSNF